jgi:aconitase B
MKGKAFGWRDRPGCRCVTKEAEARYVANHTSTRRLEYRTDLMAEYKKSKLAECYVALANRLGRLPSPEEFPKEELVGKVDRQV